MNQPTWTGSLTARHCSPSTAHSAQDLGVDHGEIRTIGVLPKGGPFMHVTTPGIDQLLCSLGQARSRYNRQVSDETCRPGSKHCVSISTARKMEEAHQRDHRLSGKKIRLGSSQQVAADISLRTDRKGHAWVTRVALFHEMCRHGSSAIVVHMLDETPDLAIAPCVITCRKQMYDPVSKKSINKVVNEAYSYPLHRAIFRRADVKVVEKLVDAVTSSVTISDGAMQESALHVLLKHDTRRFFTAPFQAEYGPSDVRRLVDMLLLTEPGIASIRDRHGNTPLHSAARWCSETAVILQDSNHHAPILQDILRHLFLLYPPAIHMRNMQGKTPLQLAQERFATSSRNITNKDPVSHILDFLQAKSSPLRSENFDPPILCCPHDVTALGRKQHRPGDCFALS